MRLRNPGPATSTAATPVQLRDLRGELLGDLARRLPPLARETQRDVRRVVAVTRRRRGARARPGTPARPATAVSSARIGSIPSITPSYGRSRNRSRGPTGATRCRYSAGGDCRGARRRRGARGDPVAGERDRDFLARLVDPPLDGRERDLERVGDLGVREADDVAEEERHLQVDGERLDGAPDGVDRLGPLERLVDDLERRDVVERDDRARTALERAQLVEHAVLRHLEQPRREPRAVGEPGQPLVDAEEDLLRQVLGEAAVADEAQHVVVDRLLVRPDDEVERPLVTALGLAEHTVIGLRQGQCAASIQPIRDVSHTIYDSVTCQRSSCATRLVPVIAAGCSRPRRSSTVGARSESSPPSRSSAPATVSDERHRVRRVRRVRADAVVLEQLLGVPVVGRHEADAACAVRRLDDLAEAGVGRLDRRDDRRDHAGVADHVRVREVDDAEPVALGERIDDPCRHLAGGHLRLQVVARDVAGRRDEDPLLPAPRLLDAAVEEVRDVRVLLGLRRVELAQPGAAQRLARACRAPSARRTRPGSRSRRCSASS